MSDISRIWKQPQPRQLAEVLVAIDSISLMKNFLRDVMTEKEIIEISARLEAARMLSEGSTYADITKQTKLSSRTVARISDWLQNGTKGYEVVLNNIHHSHTLPARAE